MELLLIALSGFFFFEFIKFFVPVQIPAAAFPGIIMLCAAGAWEIYMHQYQLSILIAATGFISILTAQWGSNKPGWKLPRRIYRRTPPGPWPPGTEPGRRRASIPPL